MATKIETLNWRGEAVVNGESFRKLVPGDVIDEKTGALITPSNERVAPFCPAFQRCGGCQLQNWREDAYHSWKLSLITSAFAKQGLTLTPEQLPHSLIAAQASDGAGTHGRRRITLHGRKIDGVPSAGFMAARSHELVDIDHCPLLVKALDNAPAIARRFADKLGACDVAFTAADNGLDVSIKAERKVAENQFPALAQLARELGLIRLTVNAQLIAQLHPPLVTMGKAQVVLPPNSFLQATLAGEQALAEQVISGVGKAKKIADLFCGVGPFALRLSEKAQVFAVDNDKPAVLALAQAASLTSGLKPIKTEVRDLMREPLVANELKEFDAVVFDPPRAGAEAQARQLARSTVKTTIAVSCDPASLSRDAAILINGGYELKKLVAVDQFKWTSHIETVALFTRATPRK